MTPLDLHTAEHQLRALRNRVAILEHRADRRDLATLRGWILAALDQGPALIAGALGGWLATVL